MSELRDLKLNDVEGGANLRSSSSSNGSGSMNKTGSGSGSGSGLGSGNTNTGSGSDLEIYSKCVHKCETNSGCDNGQICYEQPYSCGVLKTSSQRRCRSLNAAEKACVGIAEGKSCKYPGNPYVLAWCRRDTNSPVAICKTSMI